MGGGTITLSKGGTEPAPVTFSNPLSLDSQIVGGFVGLNGAGSSVTGSFCDTNSQTFNYHFDLLFPQDPTNPDVNGDTFTLNSNTGGGGLDRFQLGLDHRR